MSNLSSLAGSRFSAINPSNFDPNTMLDFTSKFPNTLNGWSLEDNSGKQRMSYSMEEHNGKIYLFNGLLNGNSVVTNETHSFDLITRSWNFNLAPFPLMARSGTSSVKINNNIYIFGGVNNASIFYNDLLKYNPITNSWVQLNTNAPSPRTFAGTTIVGTDMYIFGGFSNSTSHTNDLWKYDTLSNIWTQIVPTGTLPLTRERTSMFSLGTKIYIYAGWRGTFISDLWSFDITNPTGSWVQLTGSLPVIYGKTADVIGTDVYFYGGYIGGSSAETKKYNIPTDTWTTLNPSTPIASGRYLQKSILYNDEIYIFGGISIQMSNELIKYNPSIENNPIKIVLSK